MLENKVRETFKIVETIIQSVSEYFIEYLRTSVQRDSKYLRTMVERVSEHLNTMLQSASKNLGPTIQRKVQSALEYLRRMV